ncbi:helix-turn-helix domain-containing protein [Geosporobacter ferrireducens]|uniref:helix-turn-helix domain-containing protein n=1 Tax=Geosporobacter ferrireducens TaxID=1424294 RepID=UPI00139F17DB|nr:helix-turn-helix domain-containing protein [Geosporobacter ferrireducens]MTI53798.1 helix-turn-helix domain-containing protein [Geosporobacter ferrireducens]
MDQNNIIFSILTLKEAAQLWELDDSTLRHAIKQGKFREDEHRKSGGTWIITKEAMIRIYGEQKG